MLNYKCEKSIHKTMIRLFTDEWLYLIEKLGNYHFYAKEKEWEEATNQRACVLASFERIDNLVRVWGFICPQMQSFGYFLWKCAFIKVYSPKEKGLKEEFQSSYKSWRIYNGNN